VHCDVYEDAMNNCNDAASAVAATEDEAVSRYSRKSKINDLKDMGVSGES
jgi:hypothetical protein